MRSFLVWFIVAWLIGIGLGIGGAGYEYSLIISILLVILIWRWEQHSIAIAAGILVLLGVIYGWQNRPILSTGCSMTTNIVGRVIAEPRIEAERVQYRVELDNGCLALINAFRFPVYGQGDKVIISGGRLSVPEDFKDEYASYSQYLRRQGIGAVVNYPTITVLEQRQHAEWRAYIQQRVWQIFPEPTASIVSAMLLAQRGSIPTALIEQFQRTGTSHILSVSGLHVSLLAAMFLVILSWLPLQPWLRTVVLIGMLWLYIIFINQPISAVRAASFWTLALLSFRFGLLVSLPTVILLAAVSLVTLNPIFLFDVGFQLSVSAVTGIWLILFLIKPYRERLVSTLSRWQVFLLWLLNMLLVSSGATLATWPIVAYHFNTISIISVLANILVVPTVSVIIGLTIAALLTSFLMLPLAIFLTYPVHILVLWLDIVTKFFATIPGAWQTDISLPSWTILLYYSLVCLASIILLRYQKRTWREVWE